MNVQGMNGVLMIGGLAQLVERLLCKQDVSGSSPLTSTDQPSGIDGHAGRLQRSGDVDEIVR